MSRALPTGFSAALPLLVDASLKGAVLLVLAGACSLVLWRASAAARHVAWLAAVVALLLVPVLSVVLPGWRALPEWAGVGVAEVRADGANGIPAANAAVAHRLESAPLPQAAEFHEAPASHPSDSSQVFHAAPAAAAAPPAVALPTPASAAPARAGWLVFAWAAGCALLLGRLAAAHWLLRRATRRCQVASGALEQAFVAVLVESGVRRRVRLLVDTRRTIPVVWGVFRPRLLLPAEAESWDGAQLRSVLMHELAHVRRRDPLVQTLTQLACALHWFDPFVWVAAWRLHVERERACDDLVLASGVRPSEYAGHLLHVATQLSPARGTGACGLAMARKSSLEGRLHAVLSENLNRRGLTRALTAAVLLFGAAIAVPVAMLRAQGNDPAENPAKPPATATTDMKPSAGTGLDPGTEAQLDWGEPVNGLRGAVIVRAPDPGGPPGVYLVVQNTSPAAIRVNDTLAAERLRTLYVSASDRILFALTSGEPTQTDVLLQPREIAFLAIIPPATPADEDPTPAALIEGLRKDSLQTWKVVLNLEKAPQGAWRGKLTTADTRGAIGTGSPQPKTREARALFKLWQAQTRLNGDIPGGLLSRLHDKVKEFIRNNTGDASGDPYAKKMAPLEPRFGTAGDWKPADVVALLDDIAAVTTIPLETTMEHTAQHTLRHGQPLPAALEKADWGEPLRGGLHLAFLLEPRAEGYHLGTEVRARILLHNSGKEAVAFTTRSFHQPGHKARRADGQELTLDSTFWTTLGRPEAYRLEPDEYCEVNTPGIGIGARNKARDDWSNVRAGSWILCGEGDEVVLSPGPVMLTADESPGSSGWWLEFITERVGREAPVPAAGREREYLLYRVVRDLFGTAPSVDEGNAFRADKSSDALRNLAVLLAKRKYIVPCDGPVSAGVTKFRVLPPDPDAARRPRVARNPGRYTLGDVVRLVVTRRPSGERIVNDGSVTYYPPGKDNIIHDLKLPDGYETWAAAWGPGTTVLWVAQKGLLRKVDFADPAKVEETRYEGDRAAEAPVPPDIREALPTALDDPDAPKPANRPAVPRPATPAPATPKQ